MPVFEGGIELMNQQAERLVIAISSRALFNLDDSHRIFEAEGLEAFARYQVDNEDKPLSPGEGFPLVQKLLDIDRRLGGQRVDVILLSRNSADTGLRVFNSIQHYQLPICRAAFCGGESPYRYIQAFGCHLFLSTDADDVRQALEQGVAAATLMPSAKRQGRDESQLRIAFDGDAVVFSDEAERIYQSEGLQAFAASERAAAKEPLQGGPFKHFLAALHRLQAELPQDAAAIRTALVTARSAPAHERVIRTLRYWNIRIDEAIFLGGLPKGEFLQAFGADIFFDDQRGHCDSARQHVATGHVPHGVANPDRAISDAGD
jgi:5'-nucleotidase